MVLEVQDNPFTSILMVEAADPEALASDADPAAGQRRLVVGADHVLYLLDDAGVKHSVAGSAVTRASLGLATSDSPEFAGLNVGHASDTTIARSAAGEIAVEGNRIFRVGGADVPVADGGTGASSASAARTNLGLVPGTDVASLTAGVVPIAQLATGTPTGSKFIRDDGTLQVPPGGGGISSGTSNPGSPSNGDLFYRSDLDLLIRYRSSGTRWVCVCPHTATTSMQTTASILPMSANGSIYVGLDTTARDLFVERLAIGTIVPAGTNNGSHFWTVSVINVTLGSAVNTSADGNAGARHDLTGGTIAAGTVYAEITVAKTGSPGNVYVFPGGIIFRYIVT